MQANSELPDIHPQHTFFVIVHRGESRPYNQATSLCRCNAEDPQMDVREPLALRVSCMPWITTQTLHGVVWAGGLFLQSQSTKDTICPCMVKPWKSPYALLTSGPCVAARGELWQRH